VRFEPLDLIPHAIDAGYTVEELQEAWQTHAAKLKEEVEAQKARMLPKFRRLELNDLKKG